MKRRLISILIIIAAIVVLGLVFVLGMNHDGSAPSSADVVGESEKIIGDPEKAKVVVFEYADYGCSHCADWNNIMNELVEKYGEDFAIVHRGFNLGFKNGVAAARAATAADFQGYWKKYKDLLFKNQAEWINATASGAENYFVEYFEKASDGKGDTEKFKSDMKSDAAAAQVSYEQKMGEKINITATPTFYIDGQKIAVGDLVSKIEELMKR